MKPGMIKMALNLVGGTKMIEGAVKNNADQIIAFMKDAAEKKVEIQEGEIKAGVLLIPNMPNPADNVLHPDKETVHAFIVTIGADYSVRRKIMYYDLRNELMKADFEKIIDKALK